MVPSIFDSSYISQKNWIAIVQDDGIFTVRDIATNKLIYTFADEKEDILCCTVKDEEPVFILGTASGSLIFINYLTWKIQGTLKGRFGRISRCEKSPVGDYLAIVIDDHQLVLYDFHNQKSRINKKYINRICSIQFSSSGNYLFIGFQESIIHKYSLYPITLDEQYLIHEDYNSFSLSSDNIYIAICFNNRIEVYSLTNYVKNLVYSIDKQGIVSYQFNQSVKKSNVIPIRQNRILSLNAGGLISCCFGKTSDKLFYCNSYGQLVSIDVEDDFKKRTILLENQSAFHEIYYNSDGYIASLFKDGSLTKVSENPPVYISITIHPTVAVSESSCYLGKTILTPQVSSTSSVISPPLCQSGTDTLSPYFECQYPNVSVLDRFNPRINEISLEISACYPNELICSDVKRVLPNSDISQYTPNIINHGCISSIVTCLSDNLQITPDSINVSVVGAQSVARSEIYNFQISLFSLNCDCSINSFKDVNIKLFDSPLLLPLNQISLESCGVRNDNECKISPSLVIPEISLSPEFKIITRPGYIVPISDEVIPNYSVPFNIIHYDLDLIPNNCIIDELTVQPLYAAVSIPQTTDCNLLPIPSCHDCFPASTIFPVSSLEAIYPKLSVEKLHPRPKPTPSLRFDDKNGVYIHFAKEGGFLDETYSISLMYSDDEELKKKTIFPDNNGISDEFIFELDEPDLFYKVGYCKVGTEYAQEPINCFENGIEGYLLFSKTGKNLSIHERLPPDEVVIVIHRSNQVQISGSTSFSAVTPNWPDYDFYIIPFVEKVSIEILSSNGDKIKLRYALIKEPLLTGGNEYLDLPIQYKERFFKTWPTLLIPTKDNLTPKANLVFKITLFKNSNEFPIIINTQIDEKGLYSKNLDMGYVKIDFNKFLTLKDYPSGHVIFTVEYNSIWREFSFNLVQDLSITFQPENSPFLYINDDKLDVRVNIIGPTHISSGKKNSDCLIFSEVKNHEKLFLYSEVFSVKSLLNSHNFPLIVVYSLPNGCDAKFLLELEIPIISFRLKSENPQLANLTFLSQNIEQNSLNPIIFPVEYLYCNNFHCNTEINLPSYRKGACSLLVSVPNLNNPDEKIIRDEIHKKRNQSSSMTFSFREVYDAIHQELIFPIFVQFKYRERIGSIVREQVIDLFTINNYEISHFNYKVTNAEFNWILQLEWKEKNRLNENSTIIFQNKKYDVKGNGDTSDVHYNYSIDLDEKVEKISNIQFICANRLNRSFPVLLVDDNEKIIKNLWKIGCWKLVTNLINNNGSFSDLFFKAQHFHLLLYSLPFEHFSQYEQDFHRLVELLISKEDQNLFSYGIFLKILRKENLNHYQLDVQNKIFQAKNVQLLKQILNLIYAYNHEYTKAKVGFVNENESNDFLSLLFDSYCLEILGKNLFSDKHFFSIASDLLKRACITNPEFTPFWYHLQLICEDLENMPDDILTLCMFMKNKLSNGESPISKEDINKIKRILE